MMAGTWVRSKRGAGKARQALLFHGTGTKCLAATAILLSILVVGAGAGPLPPEDNPPVPSTLCIQAFSGMVKPSDLDKVKEAGAAFVRMGMYWEGVEAKKGVYAFDHYDQLVKEAEQRGLAVLFTLFGNSSLYPSLKNTDAGRQGFAGFAAAAAAQYRGRKVLFEIWNEPNLKNIEYTKLLKAVYPAMKKADPKCFVVGPSFTRLDIRIEWLDRVFSEGLLDCVDALSTHLYGTPNKGQAADSREPERILVEIARARELLAKHGKPDLDMVCTEYGVARKGFTEGGMNVTDPKQQDYLRAQVLVRMYVLSLHARLKLFSWFLYGGNPEWDKHALVDADGTPRAPYVACRFMTGLLKGYTLKERLAGYAKDDYLFLFENPSGGKILVVWTPELTYGKPHDVEVAVQDPAGASLQVYDMLGAQSTVNVSGGKFTIKLSGTPQYVVLSK